MTTRIEELNTRYLIPGMGQEIDTIGDPAGFEDDYGDAPYSQLPHLTDIPSPVGWQELLGLNQIPPSPSRIDPPPRPSASAEGAIANSEAASLRLPAWPHRSRSGEPLSPKIDRMMTMLAKHDRSVRRIRARASGDGQ